MKNFTQIEDTDCSDDREINQARSKKPDPVNRDNFTDQMTQQTVSQH